MNTNLVILIVAFLFCLSLILNGFGWWTEGRWELVSLSSLALVMVLLVISEGGTGDLAIPTVALALLAFVTAVVGAKRRVLQGREDQRNARRRT